MSSFLELQNELRKISYQIMENHGEVTDVQHDKYLFLKSLVDEKAKSVGYVLTSGIIDNEIDRLKSIKSEIDNAVKELEKRKQFLTEQLANYIEEHGSIEIEEDGVRKELVPNYTTRRRVNKDKLQPKDMRFEVKLVTNHDGFIQLEECLNRIKLYSIKTNNVTKVTDLPEDHPAIEKEIHISRIKARKRQ